MTDRLGLLARKDFLDAKREYQIYYVGVFFLLIALGIGYLVGSNPGADGDVAPIFVIAYQFLAPVTVLTLSHDAVAGKWATGELTVLLGLPVSRFDVIYGSILGRSAVVSLVTVVSMVVATFVSAVLGVVPELDGVAVGLFGLLVLILTFASLAVALSSLSKSTTISSSAAFGVFVLFVFQFWSLLPGIVNFVLTRLGSGSIPDSIENTWVNLAPYAAVRNLLVGVAGSVADPFNVFAPEYFELDTPFYQSPAFAVVVLGFWILVPVTLSYVRFSSADI